MGDAFYSRNHGCPSCGGMVAWSTRQCAHCRSKITWFTRMEWADEWAKTLLVLAATTLGAMLGLIAFRLPALTAPTAISAVVFCWYLQDLTALRPAREFAS